MERVDSFKLLKKIEQKWESILPIKSWVGYNLKVTLVEAGSEENSKIIEDLKSTTFWKSWESSTKSGTHVFILNPKKNGYLKVSEWAKKNDSSRQYVRTNLDKFDIVSKSRNINFIKIKDEYSNL